MSITQRVHVSSKDEFLYSAHDGRKLEKLSLKLLNDGKKQTAATKASTTVAQDVNEVLKKLAETIDESFKWKDVIWLNVVVFVYLHLTAVYGTYLLLTRQAGIGAFVFAYAYLTIGALGTTVGAHRLWAHKCYKATWQLRALLALCNSTLFFNSIYIWARDHRVHHKFTDTNADPHNYKRGFFFSHIGWLLLKKHPDVRTKAATIDFSDLENDRIVMFQNKYYFVLMPFFGFFVPTLISYYVFGETFAHSWCVSGVLRYVIALNLVWSINSFAHSDFLVSRPFDKFIRPSDHKYFSIFTNGESWHNFHHTFPWDYKTSELDTYVFNLSTAVIHLFNKIGWAYDLRTVSQDTIENRSARTGDGSRIGLKASQKNYLQNHSNNHNELDGETIWGWDDPDMVDLHRQSVVIIN